MRLIDADSIITIQSMDNDMITEKQMTVDEFIKRYTKTGEVPYVDPVVHENCIFVSKTIGSNKYWHKCSKCDVRQRMVSFMEYYCPNCGALMDGDGEHG